MNASDAGARAWRIALVDDHPLYDLAMRQLIEAATDLQWCGTRPTVSDLLRDLPNVDIAVLDLRLADGTTPYDNVCRLRDAGIRVLVYTSGEHPELLLSAARANALGVVLKSEEPAVVLDAIYAAARDEPVVSTVWASAIDGAPDLDAAKLTPQQQRVLSLYGDGETAAAVARKLGISSETVNDHLKAIRLRYAEAERPIRSRIGFTYRAIEDGFLPLPWRRKK